VTETVDGREKKRYVLGQMLPGRYQELRALMKIGQAGTLLDLVKIDDYSFNTAKECMGGWDPQKGKAPYDPIQAQLLVSNIYAQGWAFIMFLNHAEGGKYRPVFDAYFEAETKGGGHYGTLAELLDLKTDADWQQFDQKFKQWVENDLAKLK
jgi:hypothetical protein